MDRRQHIHKTANKVINLLWTGELPVPVRHFSDSLIINDSKNGKMDISFTTDTIDDFAVIKRCEQQKKYNIVLSSTVGNKALLLAHCLGLILLGYAKQELSVNSDNFDEKMHQEAYLFAVHLMIPDSSIKYRIVKTNSNAESLASIYGVSIKKIKKRIASNG